MPSSLNIRWCQRNLDKFGRDVYELLREQYPDVEMSIEPCLDACGLCTDVPFALRNQAVVAARDPRGLYAKLERGMSFFSKPALPGTYAFLSQTARTGAVAVQGHHQGQADTPDG
ncbi:hypothetical protein GCM10010885_01290 [Alicyclobacillus cellulosilyticus]|uniref:DUF1450 domain-containing protein n=1 Tax=Alicyclobacillus cellulosilyticus TaxID=1003997 RepID=A0A917K0Y6_9BACL|nr:DUF1450 domain-containing protein [Alicyclobacillus cellulosilyticus]GGI95431.1 hypothetical protein GCM10010885_01290 [Alicyclobacillus cellulosilyticus]